MANKLSNIKERVLYLIEIKKDTREGFFDKIGMTYGNFKGNAKNTPLNSTAVGNILTIHPDISPDWLILGSGEIYREEKKAATHVLGDRFMGIPLIPVSAFAGVASGDVSVLEFECERYIIPAFKDAEFLIPVKGSSMSPKFSSGDIVACKKLALKDIFFQWNKFYVIDTEQGVLIKRIHKAANQDYIKIVSENTKYEPFDLHLSQIRAVAIVIGVVRLE